MKVLRINSLFIIIFFISACSSIPKNTSNSCSIFNERYLWFKHASKSEKKWGTPVYLQLAIIKWSQILIGLQNHLDKNFLK